ncbi:hypothetical protein RHGRI_031062 [Rhododendron griersonianum]|uniref:non-specific serine/threonine protein kinase n=1 Tax=Rhododendron griersonianum TaxID=479676 RepID=A0AAV6I8V4_9ERIC|nr:hypothetical protein RHGRI_031062 [Rhododendron griersonianum]
MSSTALVGSLSPHVGNLTFLRTLVLDDNNIRGLIPEEIGRLFRLRILSLRNNSFEGAIPPSFGNLSSLLKSRFHSHLNLTGHLPRQIDNLRNLEVLQVSDNKLSGRIPSALGSCVMLGIIYLQGNHFVGDIPVSVVQLRGIEVLDLSRNNLSGQIVLLKNGIFMAYLNLSYNNFEGEVPNAGIFRNISAFSLVKNTKLCGGMKELQLPACVLLEKKKPDMNYREITLVAIILISSILVYVPVIIYCRIRRSTQQASLDPPLPNQYTKLSYADLFQATDGFASFNLIGEGKYGSIFQGILSSDEQFVAVKVLNLQQHGAIKSFIAECEALRRIRHRNIVKIITSCSSIDFKGGDFKALVLELMPNGSLEGWLHPSYPKLQDPKIFNLGQRLNIAIDIASALDYLHSHSEVAIIHCDLKPSNVLLADDFCARVSDFGLARILSKTHCSSNRQQSSSIGIIGTLGYIAPEYGMGGLLSTRGDMYSYGVLLLENVHWKKTYQQNVQ